MGTPRLAERDPSHPPEHVDHTLSELTTHLASFDAELIREVDSGVVSEGCFPCASPGDRDAVDMDAGPPAAAILMSDVGGFDNV
jgi:hypothetical protein